MDAYVCGGMYSFTSGGLLVNEEVRASISDFFSFQDKGIEKALTEGFGENNNSSAKDQDIIVTLTQNFSDANKIGLSFELFFVDQAMLHEKITSVSMDYRLKNGDGEYIDEFIPDTKPLKNDIIYTSGFDHYFVPDYANGVAQYDVIIDSNKGIIPKLEDAVIEIESINLFNEEGELQKIDGSWDLALANQHFDKVAPTFNYVIKEPSDAIEVISAIASPTSLNMQLIVDSEPFGPEG